MYAYVFEFVHVRSTPMLKAVGFRPATDASRDTWVSARSPCKSLAAFGPRASLEIYFAFSKGGQAQDVMLGF